METKTVFDHNFWVRFGENLDWYEGVDKKGRKNGTGYPELFLRRDLLDGDLDDSIKPEDKERYNEFCRQVEEIRSIGMGTKRKRKKHRESDIKWETTDEQILEAQRLAIKYNHDTHWLLNKAGISTPTYIRHRRHNYEIARLGKFIVKKHRENKKLSPTVVIDEESGHRYEFASRTACDRHFGWPSGTTATFLNSKRGIYKKRYRLIDAKEEQRNE